MRVPVGGGVGDSPRCLGPRAGRGRVGSWAWLSLPVRPPTSPPPRAERAGCWPWGGLGRKEAWSALSRFLAGPGAPATWASNSPGPWAAEPGAEGSRSGGGGRPRPGAQPSALAGKTDRSWGQKADVRPAMCALIRACTRRPGASAETLLSARLPAAGGHAALRRGCAGAGGLARGARALGPGCRLGDAGASCSLCWEEGGDPTVR